MITNSDFDFVFRIILCGLIFSQAKNTLRKCSESLCSYSSLTGEDKEDATDISMLDNSAVDLNINPSIIQCFQSRQQSQSMYLKVIINDFIH